MLTLRARIFIIISLVVLVVLGVSLGFLVRRRAAPTGEDEGAAPVAGVPAAGEASPPATTLPDGERPGGAAAPVRRATAEEVEQQAARQSAKTFIERYYTYSSGSNFQNIREVEALVSAALWERLERQIKPAGTAPAGFTALTTRVVNVETVSFAPSAAEIELFVIETREREEVLTRGQRRYRVVLVKNADLWQVSSFRAE